MCDHEAIIYLSSLGPGLRGGETVFPVALDPQKEGAGSALHFHLFTCGSSGACIWDGGPPSEAEERMIEALPRMQQPEGGCRACSVLMLKSESHLAARCYLCLRQLVNSLM